MKNKKLQNKYIATCTYSVDGDKHTSRVSHKGKKVFDEYWEVLEAVNNDMKEYAEAEREAGFDVDIVSLHLEWKDYYVDREAKWCICMI